VKTEEIEIAIREMEGQSRASVVARLVDSGVSRLTAERVVEIQRGAAEPGRARTHTTSRH
jgi:hypothetical protein